MRGVVFAAGEVKVTIDRIGRLRYCAIDRYGRYTRRCRSIYRHFERLDDAKRHRILDAAYSCFARHGYHKTSVEEVARAADIAKGMVFHYFGSKLGLFEYLVADSLAFTEAFAADMEAQVDRDDLIARFSHVAQIKLRAHRERPYVFAFLYLLVLHPENAELSEATRRDFASLMALQARSYAGLTRGEIGPLRPGLTREAAVRYINWLFEGYTNETMRHFADVDITDRDLSPYWEAFDRFLDDLRYLFYNPAGTEGGGAEAADEQTQIKTEEEACQS